MTAADYREQLLRAYALAVALRRLDLGLILAAIERAEAFGPIVDPTAFREKGRALGEDKRVVQILHRAKRELDALPWPDLGAHEGDVVAVVTLMERTSDELGWKPRSVPGAPAAQEVSGGETFDGDPSRTVFGQGAV